jgi:peptidoglycan hydrolase-like protein with peptidoglycan-binding domain
VKSLAIAAAVALASQMTPVVTTTAFAAPPVPFNQLNMDAVPAISPDGVRRVQTMLKEKGFDPGPIDGVVGSRTMAALHAYQDAYGIKASGSIDNQTLFALGFIDLAGPNG